MSGCFHCNYCMSITILKIYMTIDEYFWKYLKLKSVKDDPVLYTLNQDIQTTVILLTLVKKHCVY